MARSNQDPESVEVRLKRLASKFAELTSEGWQLSPERTLLGLMLSVEALAAQFLTRHPSARASVLAKLQQVVANVAASSNDERGAPLMRAGVTRRAIAGNLWCAQTNHAPASHIGESGSRGSPLDGRRARCSPVAAPRVEDAECSRPPAASATQRAAGSA